jgi:TonB family protein
MRSLAPLALVISLATESAIAEDDTSTITGSFVPAKPIERTNPEYPYKSGFTDRGGWVRVMFCVSAEGKVSDLVVVSSSRAGEFEDSVLHAVSEWKYEPAVFQDKPIQQCGQELMFNFQPLHGGGARRMFAGRLQEIASLIAEGRLDEAGSQIDAMDTLNNYEEARLAILRASIARARADLRDELMFLTLALEWRDSLEPEVATTLLRRSFVLNVQLGQVSAALANYSTLKQEHAPLLTDDDRGVGDRLAELARGDANVTTPGVLRKRSATDPEAAFWSTRLLRPAFQFESVVGELTRIEVLCKDHAYTSPFSSERAWKIPVSWSDCRMTVFGAAGATLTLVEFPKD